MSVGTPVAAAGAEQLRMMSLAARLYYVQQVRQRDIADRLGISQARVSRLLRQAQDNGIVRTILTHPEGLHPDLEEQIESAYGVNEVYAVEVPDADEAVPYALGWAAARFLGARSADGLGARLHLLEHNATGDGQWSGRTAATFWVQFVVEMLGDLGPPLTPARRGPLHRADGPRAGGRRTGLWRTPGVVATPALREAALQTGHVQRALGLLDTLDIAFVGVGPPRLHSLLEPGGNFFSSEQLESVAALGAAGQLNQRYLDADGQPVQTPLDDLVVGVTLSQLRRTPGGS